MLILLSPSKDMDSSGTANPAPHTDPPPFLEEARFLAGILGSFTTEEIIALMKVSRPIAERTAGMVRQLEKENGTGRSAIFSYTGTVFKQLDPYTLPAQALLHGQKHLRILSGMYGILRPFDGISPYRLEMKTPLPLPGGESLSSFWKPRLTGFLESEEELTGADPVILNLASKEYSAVPGLAAPGLSRSGKKVITVHFKQESGGGLRTIGMHAKMARGLMLRHILMERLTSPLPLKEVEIRGHRFKPGQSSETDWVFVHPEIFP